jgi:hypothetical protein
MGMGFIDGELQAVESAEEQYARYARSGPGLRVRTLEQWVEEAQRRGYKSGWARHRFAWQQEKLAQLNSGRAT